MENLLKKVLPQTSFPNFESGLEWRFRANSRPRTKFRRGVWGETLFKGSPPEKGFHPRISDEEVRIKRRASGILLHITSLPSRYGIGDMGPEAYRFIDFLTETGQGFWQILPLNITSLANKSSPYHSLSAFAGNPLLISPELMLKDGFLDEGDIEPAPDFPKERVDFDALTGYKEKLFDLSYQRFKERRNKGGYRLFCRENAGWLDDYALFIVLKAHFGDELWGRWPAELRDREPNALQSLKKQLNEKVELAKFGQYLFARQWSSLKSYANRNGVQIIGDIPIYVQYNSADLWTNPGIFKLDAKKRPYVVAGVPPDYFSATGQLWGNPIYDWDALQRTGYAWWMARMGHALKLYDMVRLDHFRGLVAYWQVPVKEKTAVNGSWVTAPAHDFLSALLKRFPYLPIIVEDLGTITADVREIIHRFQLPNMKVLLFAFHQDRPMHPYLPHTYERDCVVYTGTHDNNTIKGWFEKETTAADRKRLFAYLGREVAVDELNWELIRLAMMSVANLVIIPMQDILGLGENARMNLPASTKGNWRWRLLPEQLTGPQRARLKKMTQTYGRG